MEEKRKGILVVSYIYSKKRIDLTASLTAKAYELAEIKHTKVSLLLFGEESRQAVGSLSKCGAETIFKLDCENEAFREEEYLEQTYQVIEKEKPEIILFATSLYIKSMAPRLAARLHTGLTADCIDFNIDLETGLLVQIRPALEGSVMASILCPVKRPQMAVVNPEYFNIENPETKEANVIYVKGRKNEFPNVGEILQSLYTKQKDDLKQKSDIIVSIGRGACEEKTIRQIMEFSKLIGARIGATRAVVDAGFMKPEYQIGLTGKTVSCCLYFAFGISGAIQHLVGIKSADAIIAVNTDKEAEIMRSAQYGIIGKVEEALPFMIDYYKIHVGKEK